MTQMLELAYKNFKGNIITMFKNIKEITFIMNEQIENLSKETKAIKSYQIELKNIYVK